MKILVLPLCLATAFLAGCSGYTDAELAAATVSARKVGSRITLDNCTVQAYRVTTRVVGSGGAPANIPDATLFTADCPTAQVSSSVEVAGKNSTALSARVTPKLRTAGVSSDSASTEAAALAHGIELVTQLSRLKMQQADLEQQLADLHTKLKR